MKRLLEFVCASRDLPGVVDVLMIKFVIGASSSIEACVGLFSVIEKLDLII